MNGREVVPLDVRLGIMADRVVFTLYQLQSTKLAPEKLDVVALQNAFEFMKRAQHGRNVIKGSLTSGNAVEMTSAFSHVLEALAAIYRKKSEEEKQRINEQGLDAFFSEYMNALDKVLAYVEQGSTDLNEEDISLLLEFFKNLREVALASSASALEKVVISKPRIIYAGS